MKAIFPTRRKKLGLSVALVLLAALLSAGCATNPVTGQTQLAFMSVQEEIATGVQNYPQTTQMHDGLVPNSNRLQAYVSGLGHRLAGVSHRPDLPWEFNVVNASAINAYALPGGKISVTRGLVNRLENEDQLAFVLAHEVGHVSARHHVSQHATGVLVNLAIAGLGVGLAVSDSRYTGVGLAVAGVAGALLMTSYSRDQERQSDELGYLYMTRAGYNPRAMLGVFQVFLSMQRGEPSAVERLFHSHPLPVERIEYARQMVTRASPSLTGRPFITNNFRAGAAQVKQRAHAYAAMDQGNAYLGRKQYGRAAQGFREAIRAYGGEGLFYSRLALAELGQNRVGQAVAHARRGAGLSPGVFSVRYVAGQVFRQSGDYAAAARAHAAADRLLPSHPVNKFFVAYNLERIGQTNQARVYYRQVMAISPQSEAGKVAAKRLVAIGY